MVVDGPIADVPALCEGVRALLEGSDAELVLCDVGALADADAGTVDALARMQLAVRRLGRQVGLRHASCELQELLALMGLGDVLPLCADLRFGSRGQAEQGEQARGVQERVNPDDLPG